MLLGGDEIGRTQSGNNNAYNQDNATSWLDWTMADSNKEVLRHVQWMIAFRKAHPALRQAHFYSGEVNEYGLADITWHGTRLGSPGFDDPQGRALACTIAGFGGDADLHVMMNMFWEALDFGVPVEPKRVWRVAADTFAPTPIDSGDQERTAPLRGAVCPVQGRSIVILLGVNA